MNVDVDFVCINQYYNYHFFLNRLPIHARNFSQLLCVN